MLRGVQTFDVDPFHFQVRQGAFQLDHLVQHRFGLDAQVNRFGAHLEVVQGNFRLLQLLAYRRQLRAQELEALGGFGRTAFDVLTHIQTADFVEDALGQHRVGVLNRQVDDARILAGFDDLQTILVIQRRGQGALTDDRELGARTTT